MDDFRSRRTALRRIAVGLAAPLAGAPPVHALDVAAAIPALAAATPMQQRAATPAPPARRISVQGEFGTLKSAIVHDGSTARTVTLAEQKRLIAPEVLHAHPETDASTREKLIAQHQRLRTLLGENGVALLEPLPQPGAPYQVFARDPAFVIGETLFIASLKDPWRRAETNGLSALREQFGESVVSLSSSRAAIEGGDVMILDGSRTLLVGIHRNTDEAGVAALAAVPALAGYDLVRVPHDALHLDCCVAPLPDGAALVAIHRIPESSFRVLQRCFDKLIPLDAEEAALQLAANLLWLDAARVVSSVRAPKTNALLRRRGFHVIELDYSELVALWGSFRCTVCPIERSDTT